MNADEDDAFRAAAARILTPERKTGALCDELNAALEQAEGRLIAAGFRVQASVMLEPSCPMSFRKHEGHWGLWVEHADGRIHHVTKTSREMRVLADHSLQPLRQALIEAQQHAHAELGEAIAIAKAFEP